MLPHGPLVSEISVLPPPCHLLAVRQRGLIFRSSPADGDGHCAVRSAHASSPSARARRSGGNRSGRRARRRRGSGVPSARAAGTLFLATSEYSSSDEEEEERDGGRALPERWEPAPPRLEPWRRRRRQRLGRARERPSPGSLGERRRAPLRC
jgi:hypothetical protein